MELIEQIVKQLGVEESQAKGGLGLLLKLAQQQLDGSEFQKVEQAIPQSGEMLGAAPDLKSQGGGLMSMAMGMVEQWTGKDLGQLAELAEGFQSLNLSPEMIGKFAPMLMEWVQQNAGGEIVELLTKVLMKK